MKKIYILFLILSYLTTAQTREKRDYNIINIKSPESYSIEKINNIPINKYIGALDYNFPLFNIESSNNNYQFNLFYDSSGFKPGKKDGLFGLNWNSNIFGAITREVIGTPDDDAYPYANSNKIDGLLGLINHNYLKTDEDHFNLNYKQLDYTLDKVNYTRKDLILHNNRYYEMKSDKYYFNFLNISGHFYLSTDGTPVIVSNTPGLTVNISKYEVQNPTEQIDCLPTNSEFIITDGNGIKYFFGGRPNALEISIDHGNGSGNPAGHKAIFSQNITAWHITKVIFPSGDEIVYSYEDFFSYSQCKEYNRLPIPQYINSDNFIFEINKYINQKNYITDLKYEGTVGPYSVKGAKNSFYYEAPYYQFGITKKVKLNEIKFNNGTVNFNYKIDKDSYGYNNYKIESIVKTNKLNDTISNIRFYTSKNGISNVKIGKDTRYFINKIEKNNLTYKFEYYLDNDFPVYETKNVDYWGFWNGKFGENSSIIPNYEINYLTGDLLITSDTKKEVPSFSMVGNLKSIHYPTGGYQEFIYEPHIFSQKLERNSSTNFFPILKSISGQTSGVRIAATKMFNSILDTNPKELIEYKYDYLDKSSGIFTSLYNFVDYIDREFIAQSPNVDVRGPEKLFFEYGNNQESKIFNNSNIGYSNVKVLKNGILQSEYSFTDYNKYPDISPILDPQHNKVINNFDPISKSYKPKNYFFNKNTEYIDQSYKRGKLKEVIHYRDSNTIIEKNEYFYKEINNGNFCSNNSSTNFTTNNIFYTSICKELSKNYTTYVNSLELGVAQFIKNTIYPFILEKEVKTSFLPGGNIISSKEYEYKSKILNLLSEESSYNSKNDKITTEYLYSSDLIGKEPYTKELTELNRVLEPVITKQKVGDLYISETHNQYNLFQNIIQKSATHQKKGTGINTDVSTDRKITYDFYDNKGNILQYTLENGLPVSIIWGYGEQYPIAKIEGTAYNQISIDFIKELQDLSNKDNDRCFGLNANCKESNLRKRLDEFRSNALFNNSMVTIYTYDPLIGVTSIIQPNGQTEYYNYDTANRLQSIVNDQNEVIKTFEYNFSVKPTYYNTEIKQIVFKECNSNEFSNPITYVIPANKYSSNISITDANNIAIAQEKSNAQNFANNEGSCSLYNCQFEKTKDFTFAFTSLSKFDPNTVRLQFAIYVSVADVTNSKNNWNEGVYIGYVTGNCIPSKREYFTSKMSGSNVEVGGYIEPTGAVYITLKNYIANNYIQADIKYNRK